jgi:hypothetical protein
VAYLGVVQVEGMSQGKGVRKPSERWNLSSLSKFAFGLRDAER